MGRNNDISGYFPMGQIKYRRNLMQKRDDGVSIRRNYR